MLLAHKWTWIDKVSPMSVLYIIGLLVANFTPWMRTPGLLDLDNLLGSICIPLAIPLMLMSCSLANWSAKTAVKAFFSGLIAVLIVSVAGFFLFRNNDDPRHFAQICAVSIGIYTGGIPNMRAIAQGVGMDQETYLYLSSFDLIVTGLYLVFIICFGRPFFRKLLPHNTAKAQNIPFAENNVSPSEPLQNASVLSQIGVIVTAFLIAAVSYLLSTLFSESLSTPMLILILTTLAIAASFLPFVKKSNQLSESQSRIKPFDLGLYFVYVFCFSIANACDVRQMDLEGSLNILWYILFVIFGSLVLQILFARLIHLDSDSTMVTSVALINSPPFVPLAAALLDNKDVIVLGITVGLLGYMFGNYLGLGFFFLFAP